MVVKSGQLLGLVLLVILSSAPIFAKSKDDVVEFKSGDRLAGKIKNLEKGMLYFESDNIYEPIHLDWSKIARLTSKDKYIITLTDGKKLIGLIGKNAEKGGAGESLIITVDNAELKVLQNSIVDLRPEEESVWRQLKGGVDGGFEFTQGNSQTTLTAHADTSYLTTHYLTGVSYDTVLGRQANGTQTTRNDVAFNFQRFLTHNWVLPFVSEFLQSSQQQLDFRATVGTGIGRYLIRTNRTTFALVGGVVVDRERFSPQNVASTSDSQAEGLLAAKLSVFRFLRTSFETGAKFYPSFTQGGRYRVILNSDLTLTPSRKLYWKFSVYENFDSAPPDNTRRNDFGTSMSLGWRF